MFSKKKDWDKKEILKEAERIVAEGVLAGRVEKFLNYPFPDDPSLEWQDAFNDLFEEMIKSASIYDCCLLAFKLGQAWEKYKEAK